MNIFVPYLDAKQNAVCLDDKRLNKMVLENAQMLCAVISRYGATFPGLYKTSHVNHPCTIWAGKSRQNFLYLCSLSGHMEIERLRRGFKPHKSIPIIVTAHSFSSVVPDKEMTPFVNCTTDYKWIKDVHRAYQEQLCDKWDTDSSPPKWTKSSPPTFYLLNREG